MESRARPDGASAAARLTGSLLLVLLTLVAYAGVVDLGFVYDDGFFVLGNPTVNGGLTREGLVRAFTTTHHGQWQPLSWIAHMLDVELFGLEPAGHHLTSLALHVANVLLVLALFGRLSGRYVAAAFVALLFAVHPLHVESVAWISSRKDLVSLLFGLLALWIYAGHRGASLLRAPGRLAALVLLHAAALMGKPMLVTLPCVMLLLDAWPLGRWRGGPEAARPGPPAARLGAGALVLEKLPLFALSLAASVVVRQAVASLGGAPDLTFGERVANAVVSYGRYLRKAVWPTDLAASYPHPSLTVEGGWPAWTVALAALVVAAGFALAWLAWPRRAYVTVGWLWFAGTLVPVLGVATLSRHSMADRYTYVPLIGIYVAVVWWLAELLPKRAGALVATVAVLALVPVTRTQVAVWRDGETLFRHALAVTERNALAHNNLASELLDRGRTEEAEEHLRAALAIEPGHVEARYNLGNALLARGELAGAEASYREALRGDPEHARAHANLGLVLVRREAFAEGIHELRTAVRLEPDNASACTSLANALAQVGKLGEAYEFYERSLALDPASAATHFNYGNALLRGGRRPEALSHLREALRLEPGNAAARDAVRRLEAGS